MDQIIGIGRYENKLNLKKIEVPEWEFPPNGALQISNFLTF